MLSLNFPRYRKLFLLIKVRSTTATAIRLCAI